MFARIIKSALQPKASSGVHRRTRLYELLPPLLTGVEERIVSNSITQSEPCCGIDWPVVRCILRSLECASTTLCTTAAGSEFEPSAKSNPDSKSTLDRAAISHSSPLLVASTCGKFWPL